MKACHYFLILLLLPNCTSEKMQSETTAMVAAVQSVTEVPDAVKIYCYACHNPSAPSHDEIIAPPLAAVKMRYEMQYTSKDEFVTL
jgi:hypothetical protein